MKSEKQFSNQGNALSALHSSTQGQVTLDALLASLTQQDMTSDVVAQILDSLPPGQIVRYFAQNGLEELFEQQEETEDNTETEDSSDVDAGEDTETEDSADAETGEDTETEEDTDPVAEDDSQTEEDDSTNQQDGSDVISGEDSTSEEDVMAEDDSDVIVDEDTEDTADTEEESEADAEDDSVTQDGSEVVAEEDSETSEDDAASEEETTNQNGSDVVTDEETVEAEDDTVVADNATNQDDSEVVAEDETDAENNVDVDDETVAEADTEESEDETVAEDGSDAEVSEDTVVDDYAADTTTTGSVMANSEVEGSFEQADDSDWFAVDLEAGTEYTMTLSSDNAETPAMVLRDAEGEMVENNFNITGDDLTISFTAEEDGTYFLDVSDLSGEASGDYTLAVASDDEDLVEVPELSEDDISADILTTSLLDVDSTVASTIDFAGDSDWFSTSLEAGVTYDFSLATDSDSAQLAIMDSEGELALSFDEASTDGILSFTADESGTYFVAATDAEATGDYLIGVQQQASDDVIA